MRIRKRGAFATDYSRTTSSETVVAASRVCNIIAGRGGGGEEAGMAPPRRLRHHHGGQYDHTMLGAAINGRAGAPQRAQAFVAGVQQQEEDPLIIKHQSHHHHRHELALSLDQYAHPAIICPAANCVVMTGTGKLPHQPPPPPPPLLSSAMPALLFAGSSSPSCCLHMPTVTTSSSSPAFPFSSPITLHTIDAHRQPNGSGKSGPVLSGATPAGCLAPTWPSGVHAGDNNHSPIAPPTCVRGFAAADLLPRKRSPSSARQQELAVAASETSLQRNHPHPVQQQDYGACIDDLTRQQQDLRQTGPEMQNTSDEEEHSSLNRKEEDGLPQFRYRHQQHAPLHGLKQHRAHLQVDAERGEEEDHHSESSDRRYFVTKLMTSLRGLRRTRSGVHREELIKQHPIPITVTEASGRLLQGPMDGALELRWPHSNSKGSKPHSNSKGSKSWAIPETEQKLRTLRKKKQNDKAIRWKQRGSRLQSQHGPARQQNAPNKPAGLTRPDGSHVDATQPGRQVETRQPCHVEGAARRWRRRRVLRSLHDIQLRAAPADASTPPQPAASLLGNMPRCVVNSDPHEWRPDFAD